MGNIIDHILAEVCLDDRIQDGIFDMSNNSHMDALRESMSDKFGISLNDCKSIHNKMVEGKYPERQAYNKDGLLVTFPTPQHKARAIQRGTHFEQDPSKGQSNVFGGGQQPQGGGEQPAPAPAGGGQQQPAPNVFDKTPAPQPSAAPEPQAAPSGQSTPSSLPVSDTPPPQTPAASPAASGGSSLPASDTPVATAPGQPPLAVEPTDASGASGGKAPPPNFDTPKTPQQRAAESQVVKQMMSGGDDNDVSLSPTMPLNVSEQLANVYSFAKQMGYQSAMKIISEAMNKK